MEIGFLDIFDQCRFMIGTIIAEFVFLVFTVPKRRNFVLRSTLGLLACLTFAMTYFPLTLFLTGERQGNAVFALVSALWWLVASMLTIVYMIYCYEITIGYALYRCILGLALQQVVTVVLRHSIVGLWYPALPEENTVFYVILTIVLYAIFCTGAYFLVARKMQISEEFTFLNSRRMISVYIGLILAFSILSDITGGIFEWLIQPMENFGRVGWTKLILQYFCIGIILILCAVIFLIQYSIYEIAFLRQEKELMERMQAEKKKQYEYSKDSIEIINQKCHDLKHQIQALELASKAEQQGVIKEMKDAVLFYDSVVKTGNDVLDTILTEKSMICSRDSIKLSCTVKTVNLEKIAVIDLYTILGNALDNAIECVMKYRDSNKKVISLHIFEKGEMMCIIVDNYFQGELNLKNGLPVTVKEDKNYHGYGIKSIRTLALKYGGDIRISCVNNTFSLQIMLTDL